jgi:hypothetical protein
MVKLIPYQMCNDHTNNQNRAITHYLECSYPTYLLELSSHVTMLISIEVFCHWLLQRLESMHRWAGN